MFVIIDAYPAYEDAWLPVQACLHLMGNACEVVSVPSWWDLRFESGAMLPALAEATVGEIERLKLPPPLLLAGHHVGARVAMEVVATNAELCRGVFGLAPAGVGTFRGARLASATLAASAWLMPNGLRGATARLRRETGLVAEAARRPLPRPRCPVLLAEGADSGRVLPSSSDWYAIEVPGGHSAHTQHPAELARKLDQFGREVAYAAELRRELKDGLVVVARAWSSDANEAVRKAARTLRTGLCRALSPKHPSIRIDPETVVLGGGRNSWLIEITGPAAAIDEVIDRRSVGVEGELLWTAWLEAGRPSSANLAGTSLRVDMAWTPW